MWNIKGISGNICESMPDCPVPTLCRISISHFLKKKSFNWGKLSGELGHNVFNRSLGLQVLEVKSSDHHKRTFSQCLLLDWAYLFVKTLIICRLFASCGHNCIWTAVAFKVRDLRSASAGTLGPGGCSSEHKGEVNPRGIPERYPVTPPTPH